MIDTPDNARALGLGLLTGDDSYLSRDALELFEEAGIQHLTAASGANLGFVSMILIPIRVIWNYWLQLLIMGLGYMAYWIIAGGSGSLWRATIMATAALLSRVSGRRLPIFHSLFLLVAIGLGGRTEYFRTKGFWLSTAAIIGLFLSQKFKPGENKHHFLPQCLVVLIGLFLRLKESVIVTLTVAPLIWIFFGQVTLSGAYATLLADPFLLPIQLTALGVFGLDQVLKPMASLLEFCLVWIYHLFVAVISGFVIFSKTLAFALFSVLVFLSIFIYMFRVLIKALKNRLAKQRYQTLWT